MSKYLIAQFRLSKSNFPLKMWERRGLLPKQIAIANIADTKLNREIINTLNE